MIKSRIKLLYRKHGLICILYLYIRYIRNHYRYFIGTQRVGNGTNGHTSGIPVTANGYRNTFCGYYDVSPFNPSYSSIIALHGNNVSMNRRINGKASTDILLFSTKNKKVLQKIDTTRAWNWQQGARLGWLDNTRVVYNTYSEEKYRGVIYDINKCSKRILSHPLQCWTERYYASLDYEVLARVRPDYGYFCHKKKARIDLDSVWLKVFDIETDNCILLFSWEKAFYLLGVVPNEKNRNTMRFNHTQFSPDGERIAFLFRYIEKFKQVTTFFIYNIPLNEMQIAVKNEEVSHYSWLNGHTLLYWGTQSGIKGYHLLALHDNEWQISGINDYLPDGHPVFIDEKRFFTDTYPDKRMIRRLFLVDLNGTYSECAKISEMPVLYVDNKCDPHPSVSADRRWIQIDRILGGRRVAWLFSVEDIVNQFEPR